MAMLYVHSTSPHSYLRAEYGPLFTPFTRYFLQVVERYPHLPIPQHSYSLGLFAFTFDTLACSLLVYLKQQLPQRLIPLACRF